ncbi:hypothetical protein HZH66_004494 [Vespula vulgaris]|uniref:Uncharacterized protein n=1 Tax=Vespula vulgaris TaxID=7454 RepID=A0A834NFJ7_VESVU|nr:hypothetical protein HZH66_004494 [Vespula vulgaris]
MSFLVGISENASYMLFIVYSQHACGMLDITGNMLKHAFDMRTYNECTEKDIENITMRIIRCVLCHTRTIRFMRQIVGVDYRKNICGILGIHHIVFDIDVLRDNENFQAILVDDIDGDTDDDSSGVDVDDSIGDIAIGVVLVLMLVVVPVIRFIHVEFVLLRAR